MAARDDLELIRRLRDRSAGDARAEAAATLRERYESSLSAAARHRGLAQDQIEDVIQSVWTKVLEGGPEDLPQKSTLSWLYVKAGWEADGTVRSEARRREVERDVAQNLGRDGRVHVGKRRDPRRTRKPTPSSATPFRPIWLMPSWLEDVVKGRASADEVRSWEFVNSADANGGQSELRDLHSFDPIILGPASDLGGSHPIIRFTATWRAIANAISAGRSAIALLPAIAMTRSRLNGGDDALHNQTIEEIKAIGPAITAHEVHLDVEFANGEASLGNEWELAVDDWLERHGGGRRPMEIALQQGAWRLEVLRRYGESPRAAVGIARGPAGRILLLPYRQHLVPEDVTGLRELATLLHSLPAVVPLKAHLDASNDFDNNVFSPPAGEAWHLEPKLAAVVWAYLQERQPNSDRVPELAIKRRLLEIEKYGPKDNVGRLVNSVNSAFRSFCSETLDVTAYELLVRSDSMIRLRFPDQFGEVAGLGPWSGKPTRDAAPEKKPVSPSKANVDEKSAAKPRPAKKKPTRGRPAS